MRTLPAVSFVAAGAFTSGIGALTVPVPAGYAAGDQFLLLVESANQAAATPSGWSVVDGLPLGIGTAAAAGGVMLSAFWKTAGASEASVSVADTGNHTCAVILGFRGPNGLAAPVAAANSSTTAVTTTGTVEAPAATYGDLFVLAAAIDLDLGTSDAVSSVAFTEGATTPTVRVESAISSGAGGGLAVATAGVSVNQSGPGTLGSFVFTSATAYVLAGIAIRNKVGFESQLDTAAPVAIRPTLNAKGATYPLLTGGTDNVAFKKSAYSPTLRRFLFIDSANTVRVIDEADLLAGSAATLSFTVIGAAPLKHVSWALDRFYLSEQWATYTSPSGLSGTWVQCSWVSELYLSQVIHDGARYIGLRDVTGGQNFISYTSADGVTFGEAVVWPLYNAIDQVFCTDPPGAFWVSAATDLGYIPADRTTETRVTIGASPAIFADNVYVYYTQAGVRQRLATPGGVPETVASIPTTIDLATFAVVDGAMTLINRPSGGVPELMVSTDHGETWSYSPIPASVAYPASGDTTFGKPLVDPVRGRLFFGARGVADVFPMAATATLTVPEGVRTLAPAGIASAEAFGAPALAEVALILPAGVASAESFGGVGVVMLVSPAGLSSGEAFGDLFISSVALGGLVPQAIASAEAFGVPTLLSTAYLAPSAIGPGRMPAPRVISVLLLAPASMDPAEAFGIATIERFGMAIYPQSVVSAESVSVPIVTRSGAGLTVPASASWRPFVILGGADVSASLVGVVSVEASEGAARLADFSLELAAGTTVSLAAYVGKTVTINFADADGGNSVRLFTGVVDLPSYDFSTGVVAFRCIDRLKNTVAEMSPAAVRALMPAARHSPIVFDDTADAWQLCQDLSTTVAGSVDLSPLGVPRFTSWVPASSADVVFDAGQVLDAASVQIALANIDQIRNRAEITFEHRFPRCKKRAVSIGHTVGGFDAPLFGDFLYAGNWLLPNQMVIDALAGTGWVPSAAGISFAESPATGTYYNSAASPVIFNKPFGVGVLSSGFSAVVVKGYVQTITERYLLTVENAQSVALLGGLTNYEAAAVEVAFDASAWENATNKRSPAEDMATAVASPVLSDPASGAETMVDYFPDSKADRAAAQEAIATLVARAQAGIYASHRQNSVMFSVPLVPAIDVTSTVGVATGNINARGKVRSVIHRMDVAGGGAESAIDLAVCSVAGLGYQHPTALPVAPAAPVPVSPDAVASFSGSVLFPNGPSDSHELTITLPAIDAVSRNNHAPTVTALYAANLIEDLFEVTA